MPFPLLLLLLVGGAAAVVASSSKDGGGEALQLKPGAFRKGPLGYEKFRDPVLVCLEATQGPDGKLYRFNLGLDHLSVENTPDARVASMRSVVGQPPSTGAVGFGGNTLGRIADASYQQAQKLAITLASSYEDASKLPYLAEAMRVPVAEAKRQAEKILDLSKGSQEKFLREAAKYQGIASTLMAGVSAFASGKVSRAQAYAQGVQMAGEIFALAAAETVPVIGAMVSMAAGAIAADIREKERQAEERCQRMRADFLKEQQALMQELAPFPVNVDGEDCDQAYWHTGQLNSLRQAFRRLSIRDKAAIQQWWTLAQTTMSNPEVLQVFSRLGRGRIGWQGDAIPLGASTFLNPSSFDVYLDGRYLASDEQVMMVAAPYAVANGYDVDKFARALWAKSQGWRGADPSSFIFARTPDRSFSICQIRYKEPPKGGAGGKKESGRTCYPICSGANVPLNAWHLNFAVLARDAAELVRTLPK